MQPHNLPHHDFKGDSQPAKRSPYEPNEPSTAETLKTLPASILVKVLAQRLLRSARRQAAELVTACSRLRGRVGRNSPPDRPRDNIVHHLQDASAAALQKSWDRVSQMSLRPRYGLLLAVFLVTIPAVYFVYCVVTIPFAAALPGQLAPSAMIFQAEGGRAFATRGILKGQGIAADRIPPLLASAVVAVEDRRFYEHGGIDLRAVARAAWHDLTDHRLQGGSTITQQLVRRLYLSSERTLKRKVQEAALAEWLELRLTKNQILARYLNTAYFGSGAYGVDSAALRYFGRSAEQLSLGEAAMLAGLIRAPSELEPDRNPARARERAGVVLDAMVRSGSITPQQADAARQHPATLHIAQGAPSGNNYFLDTAATEVKSRIGPSSEDLTIRTTLDADLQRIAEGVIAKRVATAGKTKNIHQVALVALAPDGAVLAMVGGRDYNESQFNRVTQARRQPGSAFKAFVYLSALRKGYTPDSMIVDQPVSLGDWEPENYGDRYFGPVTLRTAFARSLNSVAVQLAQSVGIQSVIDTAKRLGIASELPAVPSVALGSGSVTPLEMTRAFAAIATNTSSIDSYTVRAITKGNQTVYARPAPVMTPTDSPTIHAEMIDLLSSVVREGTGRAARLDRPAAGKTGTSENYRDAWFIGFTSDLVVGVWVGNDDNSPMDGVVGGSLPATIWHDFVSAAEALRRPQMAADSTVNALPTAPTISFNDATRIGSDTEYRTRRDGWHRPFRFFGFRF
jgi:penicillin-binding protein 1A